MDTLTVYETILNSALLRLPKDMSLASKKRRVQETMEELDILKIADRYIGSTGDIRSIL
jgi:ABC-type multidrug transport system ATPase subunit